VSREVVVAAGPGFELLEVPRQGGQLRSWPIIAWALTVREDGAVDQIILPVSLGFAQADPACAYAILQPDYRVLPMLEGVGDTVPEAAYGSIAQWTFAVRANASGHALGGSA
jgi:hypothetical protein